MQAPLTLQLDEAALGALDRLAERTGSSRDRLAARAIETYVAFEGWQLDKIAAGIAAADRGDFAADEDVESVRAKFSRPA